MILSLKILKADSAWECTDMSAAFWFTMGFMSGGIFGVIMMAIAAVSEEDRWKH